MSRQMTTLAMCLCAATLAGVATARADDDRSATITTDNGETYTREVERDCDGGDGISCDREVTLSGDDGEVDREVSRDFEDGEGHRTVTREGPHGREVTRERWIDLD
ncbi:hypothetical protein V8J36_19255 [Frigidibacter sp. MR17.14]|uniref:hypothetical protein n=1 Tax=unclassified Frigidibacter TaxID=2641805 RepID=UPI003012B9EF